jgi:hypothetical protein
MAAKSTSYRLQVAGIAGVGRFFFEVEAGIVVV